VYAAVFLGLSTITILSVDALRMPVLNFLMDQSGRYSTVVYQNDPVTQIPEGDPVLARFENNLPKGYQVVDSNIHEANGYIYCEDANHNLLCLQNSKSAGGLNIDAEVEEYIDLNFSGYEAVFWEKDRYCLIWLEDDLQTVYTLVSTGLDESTFWEFAYMLVE